MSASRRLGDCEDGVVLRLSLLHQMQPAACYERSGGGGTLAAPLLSWEISFYSCLNQLQPLVEPQPSQT